jgi:hypothetical protein
MLMLAFITCGGRSEEVITLGCGPGDEGSIPSAHPIFSVQFDGFTAADFIGILTVSDSSSLRYY